MNTDRERVLEMARERELFTAAEVTQAGIHRQELTRLVADGTLERVARGRYRLAGREITEHHGLVLAATAVPHGVICLLSALSFHGIGAQLPSAVWIAVERGTRTPTVDYPPLRVVHFSGISFTEGIEDHVIEGRSVRIYGIAKTVADLFKFRNRIGLDVAIEALREGWRDRRFTVEELDSAAKACHVETVMRPYIDGVLV